MIIPIEVVFISGETIDLLQEHINNKMKHNTVDNYWQPQINAPVREQPELSRIVWRQMMIRFQRIN